MTSIIVRPLLTEKTLALASRGWYTFAVESSGTKRAIAAAIAAHYHVTVQAVRSLNMTGKERRVGKKQQYVRKPDWKKALVRLTKGQKIEAFEVTQETPVSP